MTSTRLMFIFLFDVFRSLFFLKHRTSFSEPSVRKQSYKLVLQRIYSYQSSHGTWPSPWLAPALPRYPNSNGISWLV